MKAYNETFNNCSNERINELKSAIDNIEKLLDNPNFESIILKAMNRYSYVLDAITTYVPMPVMQSYNKGDRSYSTIKQYRIALFRKLDELHNLLEDTK